MGHLDAKTIRKAEAEPGKRRRHWDDDPRGLLLEVLPSGKKVFRYHYKFEGRTRWATIGDWGAFNLTQARNKARELRRQVAGGHDPVAEKKAAKKARANAPTVSDLSKDFLAEYASTLSASTERNYKIAFNEYLKPSLGNTKLADLKRSDFIKLHREISKTRPTTANRVLSAAVSALDWAISVEILGEDATNPARLPKGKRNAERKNRGHALSEDEMKCLGKALGGETGVQADALRVYLLTGSRPDEILALRWEDIKSDGRRVDLPSSKTGPRRLYLGKHPAEIIARQDRSTELAFASTHRRNKGGKLHSMRTVWDRVKAKAKLDKSIRLYDAGRHTFVSKGYELGYAEHVVRKLSGHAESDFNAHSRYRHIKPTVLLEAAEKICESLLAEMTKKDDEKEEVAS